MFNLIIKDLEEAGNQEKAKVLSKFFKTGKGQYGEGDIFLGITVPHQREIARKHYNLNLKDIEKLLLSNIHEHRLTALLILVIKFNKGNDKEKKEIINFYLKNTSKINNWDLVDLSADKLLGNYLLNKDRSILYKLARSLNIWERRISIISTFAFIKNNQFEDTLRISEILLNDKHDLIQKAVGWMLRELGKRDQQVEDKFLKKYHTKMPRTMLRYSIERFSQEKKDFYLQR